MAAWWKSLMGMFTVDLKFPDVKKEAADDDGDVIMADTWAVHFILPARTAERQIIDLSGGLDALGPPAPKWSTIPIPRFQLRHVRVDVPGSLSIWPACRHLEIRGDWDDLGPAPILCPPTVKILTLTVYPVTPVALATIGRFIFHSAVTDLTLLIAKVPSDEQLGDLEWTNVVAAPLAQLFGAPTLQEVHLLGDEMPRVIQNPPRLLMPSLALNRLRPALTTLTLTGCLPSRLLAKFTDASWTFPPTIVHLDLSMNGLLTSDLAFLNPRWPPQLQRLNLARNQFHAVVTPLPHSLRVLNVAQNAAMREDIHPERWILALPSDLVELNVSMCQLPASVGPLLLRAREKSGQHPHRAGMWLQILARGNWEIPNEVVKALVNENL
ncbi:hypothetical protein GGF32_005738 [Allomyces javanicus]|nr:hypothetical protein GGF32_005738 [Allomyces javanicus]